jgi:outer membrane protein assembly factor BamA
VPPRATVRPLNGESNFYLFKTELRFPIYNDLGGVLFYDGGAVSIIDNTNSAQSATESALRDQYPLYRDAVGVGIRYNTPVGPVSAEYGYKLNRQQQRGESEGRFHFSIGTF